MRNGKPYNLEQREFNIVGGTKYGRYPQQTTAETVNLMIGSSGDQPSLVPYPGYKKVLSFPRGGEPREIFRSTLFERLIVVIGRFVYTVSSSLSYGLVGQLLTDTGKVFIAENLNNEIALVDGTKNIYLFNYLASTFVVEPVDFNAIYLDYHDGYFLAAVGDSASWRLSNLNNGAIWNPLDASNIQTKADRIQAVIEFGRQVFTIGEKRIDIWHNQGRLDFPYVRDNTTSIPYGCVSSSTIATLADAKNRTKLLVFLAANESASPTIMYSTGGQLQTISTPGLDKKLQDAKNPEKAFGFLFGEDDHIIYQLTFPDADFTLAYDFTAGEFYTPTDEKYRHHIAKRYAFFNNKDYFIPFSGADLYESNTDLTTYDGKTVPRARISAPLRLPSSDSFMIRKLQLQIEHGETRDYSHIDMSLSKDGGKSYGNVVTKDMRPTAAPRGKFNYWNLGVANDLRVQLRFWSRERFVITNASMEILQ